MFGKWPRKNRHSLPPSASLFYSCREEEEEEEKRRKRRRDPVQAGIIRSGSLWEDNIRVEGKGQEEGTHIKAAQHHHHHQRRRRGRRKRKGEVSAALHQRSDVRLRQMRALFLPALSIQFTNGRRAQTAVRTPQHRALSSPERREAETMPRLIRQ